MTLARGLTKTYARLDQALSDAQAQSLDWLGERELAEWNLLSHPLRQRQWLAGRWLAKQLVAAAAGVPVSAQLQILSRDERGLGTRPRVLLGARDLEYAVSIAHSEHSVLVAMVDARTQAVGVDLCAAEISADDGFCRLWFSTAERQWIEHDRRRRAAVLWSIKEAVYKAVHAGQPWSPRDVTVLPRGSSGYAVSYRGRELHTLSIEIDQVQQELVALVTHSKSNAARRGDAAPERSAAAVQRSRSLGNTGRFVVGRVRGGNVH